MRESHSVSGRSTLSTNGDLAIEARGLDKTYRIFDTPFDRVRQAVCGSRRKYYREFTALRGVSFDVRKGEALGVIGRNGSGKSTLLQILCGILDPTRGQVAVKGKIGALLELGTGFNPEVTGRENANINLGVLGISRGDIEERMESIISFADIGEFIDQPVKTYSSGMFLRLAFSVAISGQSDILIVDEILAVGDEAFQRKCFGKVERVVENGGSAIFVSHSAQTIVEICDRAILLDKGEMIMSGPPKDVVANYHKMIYAAPKNREKVRAEIIAGTGMAFVEVADEGEGVTETDGGSVTLHSAVERYDPDMEAPEPALQYESRGVEITGPALHTTDGRRVNVLKAGGEYVFSFTAKFIQPAWRARFGTVIKTMTGFEMGGCAFAGPPGILDQVEAGESHLVEMRFRANLAPGAYFLNAGVVGRVNDEETWLARSIDALMFRVSESDKNTVTGYVDFLFTHAVTRIRAQE